MTAGAFFDLDKTLIEGSSAIHFGRAAYRKGLMTRTQLARDLWANIQFRIRGSTDEGTEALRQRILDAIAGTRVRDLERLGHEVLAGVLPRVYPEVLREAYEHQDAGRPVFIVTAASQEMAELLAHVLFFDGGIGTRSEVHEGIYTGQPDGPFTYREGKAQAMRERAEAEGIDLAESYAYSDSETCRCCAWSGTRWRSTRMPSSSGSHARRAGGSCGSTSSAGGFGSAPSRPRSRYWAVAVAISPASCASAIAALADEFASRGQAVALGSHDPPNRGAATLRRAAQARAERPHAGPPAVVDGVGDRR
jgi:HAD superfamily hydrolase (TIGR01490 family)